MSATAITGWKILVSGASGFIGSALCPLLTGAGARVTRLVRTRPRDDSEIQWDPAAAIAGDRLEGFDAVVHLAGETITGRWTAAKKQRILQSRAQGTQTLATLVAHRQRKPRVFVSASAIGFYGDRGDEVLREQSSSGSSGFLPEVARAWEEATRPAAVAGIRVVNLRIGVVLSPRGGALQQMLPPFKLGLGGRLGSGRQYMSWIALDDLLGAIQFALTQDSLRGPVNAVAPNPVTNREFTKTLGQVLHRPTIFPVPAFVVKTLFGQMGEELLLASQRVEPARLIAAGFSFTHPELKGALEAVLKG
ncbi:MAG TPA: TIGR01777 family oxidoreductase [Terriglobales bacterium]|nr:TIGR01777 family oxidoreductase [Terriglobales bacterium]